MGRRTLGTPRILPSPALAAARAFDLALASLLLAAAAPVLLLAALAIRLDSPGPILFRQIRVGKDGRPFEMLKLRTMFAGANPAVHREHVRALLREGEVRLWIGPAADARVTRLGRFLRATGLDELPQLINVLRGDMRLVGPRPALPYEVDLWADWHHRRLAVPPGITGLWQVAGRERSTFDEMVRLDLAYIAAWSTRLDLSILLRTPWALLQRRYGALRTPDPQRIEA